MGRKTFATPIDEQIQANFKEECAKQGYQINETVEVLMTGFINGDIQIKKEVTYKIHQGVKK